MKIAIEEFRNAVTACERISSGKSAPVYRMIRLEADAGKLSAQASDGDYWLSLTVACEGDLEAVLVPADKLLEAATKLTADTVDIQAKDGSVVIKAGRSRRTIQTEPAKNWIAAPAVEAESIAMDAERLAQGFGLCAPFASDNIAQAHLNGVRVHSDAGNLYFAATNGNSLAEYKAGETENELAVTVPTQLASEVVKLGLTGEIGMRIGSRKIALDWHGGQLLAPIVEGNFVEYRRVIPADTNATVSADADSIAHAVRGVSGFGTKDKDMGAGVALEADGESLTLTSRSATGEAVDVVECKTEGDVPRFGISSAYMARACKFFAGADMAMGLTDAMSPIKLTSETHPDRVAVIMPRRI